MKTITLEEFVSLAKVDEALKDKIASIAIKGGNQTDKLNSLAAELGYELERRPLLDMEELSIDELDNVAGGNAFCEAVMQLLGYETWLCY